MATRDPCFVTFWRDRELGIDDNIWHSCLVAEGVDKVMLEYNCFTCKRKSSEDDVCVV